MIPACGYSSDFEKQEPLSFTTYNFSYFVRGTLPSDTTLIS